MESYSPTDYHPSGKQVTSLGDFSSKDSFGKAFSAAHAAGGSGHTFSYKDKVYTTDCADGGDYRQKKDDRSAFEHVGHSIGHSVNATIKDNISSDFHTLDKLTHGKEWGSDVDRMRAKYHEKEYIKKTTK
mmetsp:Transcript_22568/g.22400  ORF Transcript_22568/g.22400 Transcript_22568/m.22400 type:complete len:130 (-) Transcript_22568:40-429(-)